MAADDDDLLHCFLNFPMIADNQTHPLDYQAIANAQAIDEHLQQKLVDDPQHFSRMLMEANTNLIVRQAKPDEVWKIFIPDAQLTNLVKWYHQVLNHTGISRLIETINMHFYNHDLRTRVESIVGSCEACQRYKTNTRAYGELPARTAPLAPWSELAVDLIGPWRIKIPNDTVLIFNALTCIDMVTNIRS